MEMKKMPYKIGEGAIEQAKYRAKMAVREVAHPAESSHRKVQWGWASACAVVAVVAVGVFGLVKYNDQLFRQMTPMEQMIAEMKSASDEIVYDLAVDYNYYVEEDSYCTL